ncbi:site-2 protease family protein [Streptomyces sp. NPDC018833]|uniref:site-2 protease family protein n=1 Tax=Streptomyces sp. NPDC018833 TaxID=3365053 RepID=UPI0037B0F6F7
MGATFSLGRLAGVRVGVHWSVLVIFIVIAMALALGRLPEAHPDHPAWRYWIVGLAAAVVFLGSLLAHEISHAVVARRNGIEVEDITLWMLGGVARLKSEAATPGAEFRIAGVGPLVSLGAGLFFGILAGVLAGLVGVGLAVEALAWLSGINILLAVFNALPAAPLDGGRLLRAALWKWTGDQLRATMVATTAGRLLGWVLTGLGLYQVFLGAAFSGIWLMLLGWFMIAAATAESGQAGMRELLRGVPVRQAMTADLLVTSARTTVADFLADPVFRYRHSAFPVIDDQGDPVGLVTVNRLHQVPAEQRAATTLAETMIPLRDLPTARPDDPLMHLLPELDTSPANRALILDEGRLVGIVTSSDISRITSWLTSTQVWRSRS